MALSSVGCGGSGKWLPGVVQPVGTRQQGRRITLPMQAVGDIGETLPTDAPLRAKGGRANVHKPIASWRANTFASAAIAAADEGAPR